MAALSTYKIAGGDTLSSIAARQGTTVASILAANPNIKDPNKILAGANLNLPGTPAAPQNPPTPANANTPLNPLTPGMSSPSKVPPAPQAVVTSRDAGQAVSDAQKTVQQRIDELNASLAGYNQQNKANLPSVGSAQTRTGPASSLTSSLTSTGQSRQVYEPTPEERETTRQSVIDDLISQGYEDPAEIYNAVNYDEEGNEIGDFTSEEVRSRIAKYKTPDQRQYQDQIDQANRDIDTEYDQYQMLLDKQKASLDMANQLAIEEIKRMMAKRRVEMQDLNKRVLETQTQLGIRAGRQRYAGEIESGTLTDTEKQGMDRLAEIDNEERALINQAINANDEKQFALLVKSIDLANAKRKEKAQVVSDLQSAITTEETNRIERMKAQNELLKSAREEDEAMIEGIGLSVLDALSGAEDETERNAIIQGFANTYDIDNPLMLKTAVMKLQADREKEVTGNLPADIKGWKASIQQGLIPPGTSLRQYQEMTDPLLGLTIAEKNANINKLNREATQTPESILKVYQSAPGYERAVKGLENYRTIKEIAGAATDADIDRISKNDASLQAILANYAQMQNPALSRMFQTGDVNLLQSDAAIQIIGMSFDKLTKDRGAAKAKVREILESTDTLKNALIKSEKEAYNSANSYANQLGYQNVTLPRPQEIILAEKRAVDNQIKAIKAKTPPGQIAVIDKATGVPGYIPTAEFNEKAYSKL